MSQHKKNHSSKPKAAPAKPAERWRFRNGLALALVVVAIFVIYLPAMNGGPVWDDSTNITRSNLQSFGGLSRIWFEPGATVQYYPLLHTAFWLEHKLWGDAVLGYHLTNVVWHSLSVLLVYAILSRLNIPGALLAAAIFAVHPLMVESVAWITEQKNTISTVFYLSSLLVYFRFDQSRKVVYYFAALGLFVLALGCKTATVTLPVALLIIFWWQRGTFSWRRDVLPLVPYFVLAFAAGLVTTWVERKFIGAEGAAFAFTIPERVLVAGRAVWFYLSKLTWPSNLVLVYPRWTIDPAQWWQWLFPIGAVALTVGLWSVRRWSRAPLAAWLFFCATLFPVLGFFNVYYFIYSFVADHFQYVASLGIITFVSATIAEGIRRLAQPMRWLGVAASTLLVGALGGLSYCQSGMYADATTLYRATLREDPMCWMAHDNLGYILTNAGQLPDAINELRTAVALKPDFYNAQNNLAVALTKSGKLSEGVDSFRAALALKRDRPLALNNLGAALDRIGRRTEAIEHLERAVQVQPDYAEAHYNLGNCFFSANQMDEALAHFERAVQLQPNIPEAQNNLAQALCWVGRPQEGIDHYRKAIEIKPDYIQAHANLIRALALADRSDEAIAAAQKGIITARTLEREADAVQIEEWLKHYQTEIERSRRSATTPP